MSEEERFKKAIKNIKNNYKQIEQSKVNQLYLEQDLHPTTIGTEGKRFGEKYSRG